MTFILILAGIILPILIGKAIRDIWLKYKNPKNPI